MFVVTQGEKRVWLVVVMKRHKHAVPAIKTINCKTWTFNCHIWDI